MTTLYAILFLASSSVLCASEAGDKSNEGLQAATALHNFFESSSYFLNKEVQRSLGSKEQSPEDLQKAQQLAEGLEKSRSGLARHVVTFVQPNKEIVLGTTDAIQLTSSTGEKSSKVMVKLFAYVGQGISAKLKPYASCIFQAMTEDNLPGKFGKTIHICQVPLRPSSPLLFVKP